jgi:ELWxxDGT repeat protein
MKTVHAAVLVAVLSAPALIAQTPYLVKDINTMFAQNTGSSTPANFQVFDGTLYFRARTFSNGQELWKYSNGEASMLADINPGFRGGIETGFQVDLGNGVRVFAANDGTHGSELWRTDGTEAGTMMVKDINPNGSSGGVPFLSGVTYKNQVLFTANDGIHGTEPWISDGTAAGTRMIADLDGTPASSGVTTVSFVGETILITANGAVWSSDGTPEGTHSITGNIGAGTGFARIGSLAVFTAAPAESGRELWKTDGTAEGTQMIADIAPGPTSGYRSGGAAIVGNTYYFWAADDGVGQDIWATDGTAAGTRMVASLSATNSSNFPFMFVDGGKAYVDMDGRLSATDLATGTTTVLEASGVQTSVLAFGRLYYPSGDLLKWTDGTTTNIVKSLNGSPTSLTFTGGKLYFAGNDPLHGNEPWVSEDGSEATTHLLVNVVPDGAPSSNPQDFQATDSLLFFTASGGGTGTGPFWRSDGTTAGTFSQPTDQFSYPQYDFTHPHDFTAWNGSLFFSASGIGPLHLWRNSGDAISLFKDFPNTFFGGFLPTSRYLFFNTTTNSTSTSWRSDGTTEGTATINGLFGFTAAIEAASRTYMADTIALWVLDDTATNATKVADLFPYPGPFCRVGGTIFFAQEKGPYRRELWRTDGSVGGESLVKDINPGDNSSDPKLLTAAGRYLFFIADDGVHGQELWRSDGTPEGTILLKDIRPGFFAAGIVSLTVANDVVYFAADDGVHGNELWRSDGTINGTFMVADLNPGNASSNPLYLCYAFGVLWFGADDGLHGHELWKIENDTPVMVADLAAGPDSSGPYGIAHTASHLFFAASTSTGNELWALQPQTTWISINDVRVAEGTGGTTTARFTVTRSGDATGASSVQFASADGSAVAGDDYVAQSGTLSFAAGETSKVIDVTINGDDAPESDESFLITLSSASGAIIERGLGTAFINDDDRRADVSIQFIPEASLSRRFRITNAGPSPATGIRVHFSESPFAFVTLTATGFNCIYEQNPTECSILQPLAPGASVDLVVQGSPTGAGDPAKPPGITTTATLTATEDDPTLDDHSASVMVTSDGRLTLPPALTSGQPVTAIYSLDAAATQATTITLTSSNPDVTIAPPSVEIGIGQTRALFAVTAPAGSGTTVLRAVSNRSVIVESFNIAYGLEGFTPKLDVTITPATQPANFGDPMTINASIAGRRHDGTQPTGILYLLDNVSGDVLDQKTIDSSGRATFTRTDLAAGNTTFRFRYSGDATFNELEGVTVVVTVFGIPTTVGLSVPPLVCTGLERKIDITVKADATSEPPTGSVLVIIQPSFSETVTLVPTGNPGESHAVSTHTFATEETVIRAYYLATGNFSGSNGGQGIIAGNCAAMNLTATGTGSSVSLNWTPAPGATRYEVMRWDSRPFVFTIATTTGTTWSDPNLTPNRCYLYTVRAIDGSGNTLAYANPDLATTITFADDPITPGVTPIRKVHFDQLRTGAFALRFLTANVFVAATPFTQGAQIRALDVTTLRADIDRYRAMLGLSPTTYTDPTIAPGVPIRARHLQELREALK